MGVEHQATVDLSSQRVVGDRAVLERKAATLGTNEVSGISKPANRQVLHYVVLRVRVRLTRLTELEPLIDVGRIIGWRD